MKAYSVLDGTNVCEDDSVIERRALNAHLRAIEVSVKRNMRWLGAFEMDRVPSRRIRPSKEFDPHIEPESNPLYYLDTAPDGNDIPLNNTGDMLVQPYLFVSRLIVEREEVFENVNR